ncbi:MAG: alpha/beta hydrolase [Thermoleophilia bacterium]|nr:alpha/beta hydrolase [Thermoleophilia bacterium]
MAIHPGHHQHGQRVSPLPRRPRERVAGAVFEAVTRIAGFRPEMIPDHLRRQLRIIGATDEMLAKVLPRLRTLAEWPYAWEAEGDARAARGDWFGAFTAWYVAQRILLAPSPLKARLYRLAVDAYALVDQPELERFHVTNEVGDRIAGYLQLPRGVQEGQAVPCVLMLPGITGTKEELHAFLQPLLRRGIAVARIDNPVYGETEGLLDHVSVVNARRVLEHLEGDARLDPRRLHLHGMSLGANFALQSARGSNAASVTVICAPFRPGRYFRELPTLNLTALQHMTQRRDVDDLVRFAEDNTLEFVAPELTMPVRIFHGGRDRTIPVADGHDLARAVAGPVALTVYERDHHNCLEHLDEITALTLELFDDPVAACERHAAVERVDAPASIHVTDEEALLAGAGVDSRRRLARLPFLLPGMRPRSQGAGG